MELYYRYTIHCWQSGTDNGVKYTWSPWQHTNSHAARCMPAVNIDGLMINYIRPDKQCYWKGQLNSRLALPKSPKNSLKHERHIVASMARYQCVCLNYQSYCNLWILIVTLSSPIHGVYQHVAIVIGLHCFFPLVHHTKSSQRLIAYVTWTQIIIIPYNRQTTEHLWGSHHNYTYTHMRYSISGCYCMGDFTRCLERCGSLIVHACDPFQRGGLGSGFLMQLHCGLSLPATRITTQWLIHTSLQWYNIYIQRTFVWGWLGFRIDSIYSDSPKESVTPSHYNYT